MGERLRLLFCDHLSIARGKYLPADKIGDGESRFALPLFGTHYDKDLLKAPGAGLMDGLPDMVCRYKAADIRDSWDAGQKVVVGSLYDNDGAPLALCGRSALQRAVAAWQARGLAPKIGIELECYALIATESGRLVPYDNPGGVVYGTGAFTDPLRFTDAIWETAERMGFKLEMMTAEYDAPQFEFTLKADDALAAMDDVFLFRQMAREVALEFGVILTFMPKPIAEAAGSGMHINFSFTDTDGNNALAAGQTGTPAMNDLARGCVAGLMHHHAGLAGLVAPTATSYQRLQPASLSGYWQNWAGDHRGVTVRVVGSGNAARLEHRAADASANPYTAVAAVLQASMLGQADQNAYALQAMETGDCMENTDAKTGTAVDLRGAIADLEKDQTLVDAVGAGLVANHAFMKRKEFTKTRNLEGDELRDFYVYFI